MEGASQRAAGPAAAGADGPVSCVLVVVLDGDLVETPEHIGVSSLLAVLRSTGISSRLVEVEPERDSDALAEIRQLDPAVVGISLTTVNLPRAAALGQSIRQALPGTHICVGGPIATFLGRRLFGLDSFAFLDSMVRGEAEEVITPLVQAACAGEPVGGIPGVTVRDQAHLQAVVAVDDLDSLPWPARDQLEAHPHIPYVRISTSRGCTSSCTFCNAPHARNNLAKRKVWRGRDPSDVIEEIDWLVRTFDVDTFDFVDSTFEDPAGRRGKERVRAIAQGLVDRDLRVFYNMCSQALNWTEDDHELLDLLQRSGLEKVLIGIEAGSDEALRRFNKRSTTADNRRAIGLFREHGVYVAFGFIMFHPYATVEDLQANASFLTDYLGHNLRRFVTRLELYPGAEVIAELSSDGLLDEDYWQTLNPYAYRYRDERIGHMASKINGLFGADYRDRGSIAHPPKVFDFETYDIRLHTFVSRLGRLHGEDTRAMSVVDEYLERMDEVKGELTRFNAGLFSAVLDHALADEDLPEELAPELEARYATASDRLQAMQLRMGMALRRIGVKPFERRQSVPARVPA
jgi:anaerobic magnesium-protoporphyrin IX monomethyl ester cyclase